MSDFLTHLAARALAQPTLRPRARMRFEPEGGEEPAAMWPERPSMVTSGEREPEPVATHETPRAELDSSEPQAPRVITRDVVRTEQRVRIEPHVETRMEREVLHRVEPRVRMRDRIVREREIVHTRTENTKLVPHRYDEEPPVIARGVADSSAPREARRNPGALKPAATRERSATVAIATPPAQPDVHVSIGRVEVRAVSLPVQRKPSPRSGTMTIDDYVAKRNRERR